VSSRQKSGGDAACGGVAGGGDRPQRLLERGAAPQERSQAVGQQTCLVGQDGHVEGEIYVGAGRFRERRSNRRGSRPYVRAAPGLADDEPAPRQLAVDPTDCGGGDTAVARELALRRKPIPRPPAAAHLDLGAEFGNERPQGLRFHD
jgi:hypothetical protein